MRGINGRVALVTGAASRAGIGFACARRLAQEGARVLLTDIAGEELESSVANLRDEGFDVKGQVLDVIDETGWDSAISNAVGAWGRLDALINNAGIAVLGSVADLTLEQFRRQSDVNIHGLFLGCRAAMRQMRTQGGGGSIVNMSSIAAFVTNAISGPYSASKGAVNMLSKSLALEGAPDGIRVNSVHPGIIDTKMLADSMQDSGATTEAMLASIPLRRLGEPKEVAAIVAFLVSDDASYCLGSSFIVDGGIMTQ